PPDIDSPDRTDDLPGDTPIADTVPPTDTPDAVDTDPPVTGTADTGTPCAQPGLQRRLAGDLTLAGDAWAIYDGEPDSLFGYAVAGVGDVTGDGLDDLTTVSLSEEMGTDLGGVYLLNSPFGPGLSDARQDAVRLTDGTPGTNYDYWTTPINTSMQALPDVNGDGLSELVLAAPSIRLSDAGRGTVFVVASPIPALPGTQFAVDPSYARIIGYEAVDFGYSTAVGDLDADGDTDLVASSPMTQDSDGGYRGRAYIFAGPIPPGQLDERDAAVRVLGDPGRSYMDGGAYFMGQQVLAGDLTGDGVDELVITSPTSWVDGTEGVGEVFVFAGPITGDLDTRDAVGTLQGQDLYHDNLGVIAAFLGDTDGDGLGEFGLSSTDGADNAALGKNLRGNVWIVDGPVVGTVRIADRADTRLYGEHDYDQAVVVDSAGDLDQDGLMDVAVARTSEAGDSTGAVYVYYGALPGGARPMGDLADATIQGDGLASWPVAIAGAGDVDGDCMPDLAVGARFGDAVYLLRGGTL
nr:FG-GAP repeat protein [Deltaproteobacteria bacterium]